MKKTLTVKQEEILRDSMEQLSRGISEKTDVDVQMELRIRNDRWGDSLYYVMAPEIRATAGQFSLIAPTLFSFVPFNELRFKVDELTEEVTKVFFILHMSYDHYGSGGNGGQELGFVFTFSDSEWSSY